MAIAFDNPYEPSNHFFVVNDLFSHKVIDLESNGEIQVLKNKFLIVTHKLPLLLLHLIPSQLIVLHLDHSDGHYCGETEG
jgi:hypothetical protein